MAASGVILVSARAWRKGFGKLPAGSGQHAGRRVHHLFCLCGSHVPLCGSMKMRSPSSIGAKSSWRPINVRRGWGVVALLVFAVVIGVAWWSMLRTTPVQYVTAPVVRGAITRVVTATGTVNPVLTIIVGTYVSGIIQNLYCDYNTQARAGQVCAKIDPRPYQATLDQYSGAASSRSGGARQGPYRSRALPVSSLPRTRSRINRPKTKSIS